MVKLFTLKSEFSKNVLVLTTGTAIAQAIPIAISPILTRLYSPEDFGVLALYISITTILSMVATCRYEYAILLPEIENDAKNISGLTMVLCILFSLLIFFIVFIFNNSITHLFGNPEISYWLYWIPVSVLLMGIFQITSFLNTRNKKYKLQSQGIVVQSVSTGVFNLGAGQGGFGVSGLIFGKILGYIFSTFLLSWGILKSGFNFKGINIYSMINSAKKYSRFVKYELPSSILNSSSSQAPIILLTTFFDSSITGFFSLAQRILILPMSILGGAISKVFLQEITQNKNNYELLRNNTLRTFKKLLFVAIVPMTIMAIYGDVLFEFVFGKNWYIAGLFAQMLTPWLFIVFIVSPLSSVFIILERQNESFFFNFLILLFRVLILIICYIVFDKPMITVFCYSLVGTIFWIIFLFRIFYLVGIKFKNVMYLLYVVPFLILLSLTKWFL